jgi:membrane protease YdiL (CAAX protease family)
MLAALDSYQSLGPAALPGFFLGLTCGAVVLTWVYNRCGHSILAAAVWHGCYNLATAAPTTPTARSAATRWTSPRRSPDCCSPSRSADSCAT